MKLENAKPCPFCGCDEIELKELRDNDGYCSINYHVVKCSDCGASTHQYREINFKRRECINNAINAWNGRV